MLRVRTVLHPTDLSGASEPALGVALDVARKYRARLLALHVYPHQALFEEEGRRRVDALTEALRDWVETAARGAPPVGVECRAAEGSPTDLILSTAEAEGCDLIVMGTHGRSGIRRTILGSVAEGVARAAPCGVITVRQQRVTSEPGPGRAAGTPGPEVALPGESRRPDLAAT